ncbi:MAG: zinc-dependent metalloprotease, partial [Myxococcota bacterium]
MKVRSAAAHRALLIASVTVALGAVGGCVPRTDDINRVQPGYVRKAIFQTDDEWYYRRTIAQSETTNSFIIEGQGDLALDRVRFEIQEDLLIAYQPYENLPGTNTAELEGNEFFKGPVLAAWTITSHFDIVRDYDALTGNERVTVNENAVDRPWYERDYMRVAWNVNLVQGTIGDQGGYWIPVSLVSSGSHWVSLEEDPDNPFASRFSDDYVEVNEDAFLGMDLIMCAAMTGFSFAGYTNCGFGEAKVRHAFMKAPPTDYIPRDFPDSVVRKGPDGQPMFDPDTGEVEREPIYNRFGIFRIETPTYDPGYGLTESGRLFRAKLFDLWENHTDGNGNPLPYAERTEQPIIYYLNAEYPERYRQVAREVAADYNRIFTSMVADMKGIPLDRARANEECGDNGPVKCMFEIRDNTCNESEIQRVVAENPDLLFAVERAVCVEGEACDVSASDLGSVIGIGNLKEVCTSLEAATMDPATGKSTFDWQRIGDPRHSMVVWLNNPQRSPWGGYGPTHADARTGRSVSATSFIRGNSYEVGASNVVDYIELINDERSIDDIVYGQDIRRHVRNTLDRAGALSNTRASPEFLSRLDGRMDRHGTTRSELLPEVDNSRHQLNRLDRVRGTRLEDALVSELDMYMAANGTWNPASTQTDEYMDELKERASVTGRLTAQDPTSPMRRAAQAALAEAGYCFLAAEVDPHWEGMAESFKDVPREERYRVVSERLIKHVILHELGHNVGLAHNFEGTYDAMNYAPQFWRLQDASDAEKVTGRQDEFRHTTVMEYMSAKGAFADFMGSYDEAAIRFGYANQVQVFDGPNVDPNLAGGEALREWRYLNDYRDIPDHLCGPAGCTDAAQRMAVLSERRWVTFDPQNPPANEVPYLFCDNYYNQMTPFCATFDYGSNLREIFANYYTMWSGYFFFNNFARDRLSPLSWDAGSATVPAWRAMSFLDTTAQYFYFLNATGGQEFRQTDLHEDMATTMAHGLNMATEIISTPEPERMCP